MSERMRKTFYCKASIWYYVKFMNNWADYIQRDLVQFRIDLVRLAKSKDPFFQDTWNKSLDHYEQAIYLATKSAAHNANALLDWYYGETNESR